MEDTITREQGIKIFDSAEMYVIIDKDEKTFNVFGNEGETVAFMMGIGTLESIEKVMAIIIRHERQASERYGRERIKYELKTLLGIQ